MKKIVLGYLLVLGFAIGCKKDTPRSTPVLTTAAVTNITSNTANTGGNITSTGGTPISKSGVCYALHNNPSVSDSINYSTIAGTGPFQNILTSLNANSTYYVAAFAINGSGTAYGSVDSFATAKGIPTITTNAVTPNSQSLAATSGWTLVNNGGSPITAIGLVWSTSPLPTISSILKTADSTNRMTFIDTLTGLNVATYYVRAYASNGYGTAYGNQITFTVSSSAGIVTDIDGNDYTTVVIGTQIWMGSNLKVTHYQNGDPITNGSADNFNWWTAILDNHQNPTVFEGTYTYPKGDSANKRNYGLLYNNFVVDDNRGICPTGWHVPSVGDWEILAFYEGAPDTTVFTVNPTTGNTDNEFHNILSNLLVGGVSGLNLQFAGNLNFGPSGIGSYSEFTIGGFYYELNTSGQGVILNDCIEFGSAVNPLLGPNVIEEESSYFGLSIRCLKN